MLAALGKVVPSYATVNRWMVEFLRCRESPRSGRPVTVTTYEIVTIVHDIVMGDKRVTETYLASVVCIYQESAPSILRKFWI